MLKKLDRLLAFLLRGLVRLYQITLSPFLGRYCRFRPTCSAYMIEALEVHGAVKGGLLGIKRLCRCHPFTKLEGGFAFDPVPSRAKSAADHSPPSTPT